MKQILIDGAKALGISLPEQSYHQLEAFHGYLEEQNKVMNLTAITGVEDVARLHFLDCLALLGLQNLKDCSVIDIGTGAGFPGLPLCIAEPSMRITLLDSLRKRIDFIEHVCTQLSLEQVTCVHGRAEEYLVQSGQREAFQIAVSRAVSHMQVLAELCLPYVAVGGFFLAMKGPNCADEIAAATRGISILGGGEPQIHPYTIPGTDIVHSLVVVEKVAHTPSQYPRRFAKIQKEPL